MQLANWQNLNSIAFPAISTGVYGFPAARAARLAVDTVRACADTTTSVRLVLLVAFDQAAYQQYQALLALPG
jgi:O-acetyl-ADP-ribose deacetylase (regulator of RNase III)